jgi:Capsular polysaccharide synthesis protein
MAVPKILWSLWLQGWDSAPDLVRACAASWIRLNPEWDVRLLTRSHVERLLAAESNASLLQRPISPAALSDVVRLELLARYGGVWADATSYCLSPLDDWLPGVTTSGFFAFDRPAPDRMLATWFLAAVEPSPAILRWRALARAYWMDRSAPETYFWCHYLFAKAYEADAEVQKVWDSTPRISADGPHVLVPYQETLPGPVTGAARSIVERAPTPLLKLTHRVRPVSGGRATLYDWLCERERHFGSPFGPLEAWIRRS